MERAHGVAAAADAGYYVIGQAALGGQDLRPGLASDYALEIAHHRRVGMGAYYAAD